jgi:hypothetical protein
MEMLAEIMEQSINQDHARMTRGEFSTRIEIYKIQLINCTEEEFEQLFTEFFPSIDKAEGLELVSSPRGIFTKDKYESENSGSSRLSVRTQIKLMDEDHPQLTEDEYILKIKDNFYSIKFGEISGRDSQTYPLAIESITQEEFADKIMALEIWKDYLASLPEEPTEPVEEGE